MDVDRDAEKTLELILTHRCRNRTSDYVDDVETRQWDDLESQRDEYSAPLPSAAPHSEMREDPASTLSRHTEEADEDILVKILIQRNALATAEHDSLDPALDCSSTELCSSDSSQSNRTKESSLKKSLDSSSSSLPPGAYAGAPGAGYDRLETLPNAQWVLDTSSRSASQSMCNSKRVSEWGASG